MSKVAAVQSGRSGPKVQTATPLLPEAAAFAVILMWGTTFTLTKSLYAEMTPLSLGGLRFIVIPTLAFLVLIIGSRREGKPENLRIRRADLPLLALTGLLGYTFYQLGFLLGLQHTSAFAGALMISLQPLVTLVIVRFLGERQTPAIWLGAIVALVGVAIFLFSGDEESKMLGNLIAFGGGVSFALYQVFNRRLIREYPSATYSAWSTLFGSIPLVLIGIPAMAEQDWGGVSGISWLSFLYMCIFPVYIAYILWGWAIRHRGVTISGFTLLVPIVAGVFSWLFLGEEFGPQKIIGGGLALAGLVWMQWANHRRQQTVIAPDIQ